MYVENLHLHVTRNCTLECEHCMRGDRERVNMSPAILDEIFKNVKKVGMLLLTGGEPLIAIQTLEYLVYLLKTKQVKIDKITIVTNGTILSDRVLKVLHDLQDNSYLVLRMSTNIFHNLELHKKNLESVRDKNLKVLSSDVFYNFAEYGQDKVSPYPVGLINLGRTKTLTPERLAEINSIARSKYIINTYVKEGHPNTRIINNKVEGNITVDVYGNIVSYGQSFEDEDKEAYETGLNVLEMSCEDAIRKFVDNHRQGTEAILLKLGIN